MCWFLYLFIFFLFFRTRDCVFASLAALLVSLSHSPSLSGVLLCSVTLFHFETWK